MNLPAAPEPVVEKPPAAIIAFRPGNGHVTGPNAASGQTLLGRMLMWATRNVR